MKTQVTISAYTIQVSIAGISIEINRDELFQSIDTVQMFIKNIWPEDHKKKLEIMGFNKSCQLIKKYKPLALRALACYTFEETASSIIIINEDGTIEMKSCEQNAKLDVKALMQVVSELSKLMEDDEKERAARRKEEEEEEIQYMFIRNNATYGDVYEILKQNNLITFQIKKILQECNINREASALSIELINNQLIEFSDKQLSFEFSSEKEESTDQRMIDNEIEFNSRPTVIQVLEAINASSNCEKITWEQFYAKMEEEHGLILRADAHASTSICNKACDMYGFVAINHFNFS